MASTKVAGGGQFHNMSCRGVHFAVTEAQAQLLLVAENKKSDDAVMVVVEDIEEAWEEDFLQETDKAWDAIHRCLSDGTLTLGGGSYPLKMCALGGRQLCYSGNYYVVYVAPNEVVDVAVALTNVSKDWFKERYWKMHPGYEGERSDVDFDYTWEYVGYLKDFYERAARANRSVIFTVSQ